jgi:glycosyltransferase involved in cell wall biosynthesis
MLNLLTLAIKYTIEMIIAVNSRFLIKNKEDGIFWYSYETLRRITVMHPEHRFIFLFDRKYSPEFVFSENIIPVVIPPPARHPVLWFMWFEFFLPRALKKYNAELFLSPDGFLSLRAKLPSLIVIHDINFFHRPFDLPFLVRWYYNYFFPRFAKKATRICTVSEFSKQDICSSFLIQPDKIDVHYNGVNPVFRPIGEERKRDIRNKYTGGKSFFIFTGSLHPRKNLVNLLKAFDHFRHQTGKDFRIVIAGRKMFLNKEMVRIYRDMNYRDDVIFTGFLHTDELAGLLAAAEALILVSYYEGFGLPVLEAMMCDVPVIVSDKSSLPEIAGDAALYADPDDSINIADVMEKLISTPELRNDLIRKGRSRIKHFSWDKTAEGLWKSVESLVDSKNA